MGRELFGCLSKLETCRDLVKMSSQKNSTVPDEPSVGGAMPLNCEKSSFIYQVARKDWNYFILIPHLFSAQSESKADVHVALKVYFLD